ncbi:MAG: CinA family protein [Clostridia bacterium]|nr:CinA family protein [Clostridia bacterium]
MRLLSVNNNEVVSYLIENHLTVTCAESCTGGLLASTITAVPGSSACFDGSIVSYANSVKHRELKVKSSTLRKYGAVSPETAMEMCLGAYKKFKSDIAVSITGIAGPGGGTEEKPVGLVYLGIKTKRTHIAIKLMLSGTRDEIRSKTVQKALDEIYLQSVDIVNNR